MKLERIRSSGETQEVSVFMLLFLTVRTFILQRNEKQQDKTDQGPHDS